MLEVFASEDTRAQQTARIALDQMGLLSVALSIHPLLNERDYGTRYDEQMDIDPACTLNGSQCGVRAEVRVRGFIAARPCVFIDAATEAKLGRP